MNLVRSYWQGTSLRLFLPRGNRGANFAARQRFTSIGPLGCWITKAKAKENLWDFFFYSQVWPVVVAFACPTWPLRMQMRKKRWGNLFAFPLRKRKQNKISWFSFVVISVRMVEILEIPPVKRRLSWWPLFPAPIVEWHRKPEDRTVSDATLARRHLCVWIFSEDF